jgi:hypothetical protein
MRHASAARMQEHCWFTHAHFHAAEFLVSTLLMVFHLAVNFLALKLAGLQIKCLWSY